MFFVDRNVFLILFVYRHTFGLSVGCDIHKYVSINCKNLIKKNQRIIQNILFFPPSFATSRLALIDKIDLQCWLSVDNDEMF